MSCEWECVSEALAEMVEIRNQRSRPVFAVRFLSLPLHDRKRIHDVLDDVPWSRELFAEGGGRVAGPFFVGADVEAEEGGGEFAAELEATLLVPPLRGPSIAAVAGEGLHVPRDAPASSVRVPPFEEYPGSGLPPGYDICRAI